MYTLDQVRCFVAVAEHLHFGRAAAELNMTQPPLSRQIQKLERAVGAELLARDNRRVRLTPAGRQFLGESRKLLALAERAPEGARQAAAGIRGTVTIGFTAACGFSLLGPLLSRIRAAEPEIAIELVEMVTSQQLQALGEGRIDLGLGRTRTAPEGIARRLLLSEHLVLALPSSHPLADPEHRLVRADIAGQGLILHSARTAQYFYDLVVKHFDIDHHRVQHSLSQIMTMIHLVAAGHGIAFVPESARSIAVPGVVFRPVEDLQEEVVELQALWRRDVSHPALHRVLDVIAG